MLLRLLALLVCVSTARSVAATHLESGQARVSLLELYTSEGCASCPPAEGWLSQHYGGTLGWHSVVPIAFHVDYWDQLGWRDRFAKREFTVRQQTYSANWNSGSVYTPCFVLNGREWQGWFRGGILSTDSPVIVGNLEATITGDAVDIRFTPAIKPKDYVVFVAPLVMQAASDVRAGENTGRHLNHDFVALSLTSAKMQQSRDSAFAVSLVVSTARARAIAIWVTQEHSLVPIQALGGLVEAP
ncbi:MAG TPA: DUF1223 domain-containing protein [Chthoniobacterales bacterium]|nr:DUF1223 domain-containing protein [Chthoniobacterales bacterium]